MWRSIASNTLTLFIVLLVVAAGLLAWGREAFTGAGPLTEAICFRVDRGASLSAVSRALADEGATVAAIRMAAECAARRVLAKGAGA